MVESSRAGSGREGDEHPGGNDSAVDVETPGEAGTEEEPEALDTHVPDKQIFRWKDDGGAVRPDG